MAGGAIRIPPCTRCGGVHAEGACLSWITAHDAGKVVESPAQHLHCTRCGKRENVTTRELQASDRRSKVPSFIRTHARCLERRAKPSPR